MAKEHNFNVINAFSDFLVEALGITGKGKDIKRRIKMKVVLSLICALALMFAGCSDPNETEPANNFIGTWHAQGEVTVTFAQNTWVSNMFGNGTYTFDKDIATLRQDGSLFGTAVLSNNNLSLTLNRIGVTESFEFSKKENGNGGNNGNVSWSITNLREGSSLDDIVRIFEMQSVSKDWLGKYERMFVNKEGLSLRYIVSLIIDDGMYVRDILAGEEITYVDTAGLNWEIMEYFTLQVDLETWLLNNIREIKRKFVLAFDYDGELESLPETKEGFSNWYSNINEFVSFWLQHFYGKAGEFIVGMSQSYSLIIPIGLEEIGKEWPFWDMASNAQEIAVLNDVQAITEIMYGQNTQILQYKTIDERMDVGNILETVIGNLGNVMVERLLWARATSRQSVNVKDMLAEYLDGNVFVVKRVNIN